MSGGPGPPHAQHAPPSTAETTGLMAPHNQQQQQRPRASTIRLLTAAALGFTALFGMSLARHSGLTDVPPDATAITQPDSEMTAKMGVTRAAFLEGARRERVKAPESVAASTADEQPGADADVPAHLVVRSRYTEAPRTGAASDLPDAAGEALGTSAPAAGRKYATPFPEFNGDPRVYRYKMVAKFKHDPNAFTQGLLYLSPDTLFESTGAGPYLFFVQLNFSFTPRSSLCYELE